ncbi:MAG: metalloregulator ArsR/SmtB family transcription factor [Henriciella sp.]|jgi:DNA-binding transcriptional ArsR family regulator
MPNEVFKALGHPLRRQVMDLLRKGPRSSGELAEALDAAWPTVTRHLNVLKDADLITAERRGTSIIYRANTSVIEDAVSSLMGMLGKDNGDDDLKEAAE